MLLAGLLSRDGTGNFFWLSYESPCFVDRRLEHTAGVIGKENSGLAVFKAGGIGSQFTGVGDPSHVILRQVDHLISLDVKKARSGIS